MKRTIKLVGVFQFLRNRTTTFYGVNDSLHLDQVTIKIIAKCFVGVRKKVKNIIDPTGGKSVSLHQE